MYDTEHDFWCNITLSAKTECDLSFQTCMAFFAALFHVITMNAD